MADVYEQLTLDREFDDFGDWVRGLPERRGGCRPNPQTTRPSHERAANAR